MVLLHSLMFLLTELATDPREGAEPMVPQMWSACLGCLEAPCMLAWATADHRHGS